MGIVKQLLLRGAEVRELIVFLWKVKLWYLIPFIIVLLAFSLFLVFAQTTGLAPFIYTLF